MQHTLLPRPGRGDSDQPHPANVQPLQRTIVRGKLLTSLEADMVVIHDGHTSRHWTHPHPSRSRPTLDPVMETGIFLSQYSGKAACVPETVL